MCLLTGVQTPYGTTVPSLYVFFFLVQTAKQYPYNLYAARWRVRIHQNGLCCTPSLGLSPLRVGWCHQCCGSLVCNNWFDGIGLCTVFIPTQPTEGLGGYRTATSILLNFPLSFCKLIWVYIFMSNRELREIQGEDTVPHYVFFCWIVRVRCNRVMHCRAYLKSRNFLFTKPVWES